VAGRILFLITLMLILTACSSSSLVTPTSTPTLPLLIMDEVHFLDSNAVYTIPPGDGFILDSRSYTFRIPPTSSGPLVPNFFQIIGDSQYYGMEWESEELVHKITAHQLTPLSGTTAFNGFKAGQRFVVAVGNMTGGFFTPLWTANVEVR
jgi:hypothetical protein